MGHVWKLETCTVGLQMKRLQPNKSTLLEFYCIVIFFDEIIGFLETFPISLLGEQRHNGCEQFA